MTGISLNVSFSVPANIDVGMPAPPFLIVAA